MNVKNLDVFSTNSHLYMAMSDGYWAKPVESSEWEFVESDGFLGRKSVFAGECYEYLGCALDLYDLILKDLQK